MQALLLVLRNHLFQIFYAGVGVILAAGTILTGRHVLPETDERLYEDALSIGVEMDTLGFQGYRPEKYKVRIFDGTYDFVLYDGNMTRENAAFPALAATAQEVDGEMQVIVPVYDSLKNLIDIVDTAEGAAHGETSFQTGLYTGEDHVATIWHELFHAWQSDHGFDEALTVWESDAGIVYDHTTEPEEDAPRYSVERIIVDEVDANAQCRRLFEEEIRLMRDAYFFSEDEEEFREKVQEAVSLMEKRRKLLSDEALLAERYLCTIEGMARYAESFAYRAVTDDLSWEARYLRPFEYTNGSGKYYEEGMWICLLLDRLTPGWQKDYSVSDLYELVSVAISSSAD
ncbi:MAG: hypothetical protein IJP92_01450 [Lachnospiraceae bacterium]|nr:hypothetical protein [Lachnospiraceae bacterium]